MSTIHLNTDTIIDRLTIGKQNKPRTYKVRYDITETALTGIHNVVLTVKYIWLICTEFLSGLSTSRFTLSYALVAHFYSHPQQRTGITLPSSRKLEGSPVPLLALPFIKAADTPRFFDPRIELPTFVRFSKGSANIYMISLSLEVISFDRNDNLGVSHSSSKVPEVSTLLRRIADEPSHSAQQLRTEFSNLSFIWQINTFLSIHSKFTVSYNWYGHMWISPCV